MSRPAPSEIGLCCKGSLHPAETDPFETSHKSTAWRMAAERERFGLDALFERAVLLVGELDLSPGHGIVLISLGVTL